MIDPDATDVYDGTCASANTVADWFGTLMYEAEKTLEELLEDFDPEAEYRQMMARKYPDMILPNRRHPPRIKRPKKPGPKSQHMKKFIWFTRKRN